MSFLGKFTFNETALPSGSTIQEVKVVNESWDPVYVTSTD